MQPPSQAPRTPASGHDTDRAGPRRSTNPSAQCENCPSRQTQYPRFHELAHALGVGYRGAAGLAAALRPKRARDQRLWWLLVVEAKRAPRGPGIGEMEGGWRRLFACARALLRAQSEAHLRCDARHAKSGMQVPALIPLQPSTVADDASCEIGESQDSDRSGVSDLLPSLRGSPPCAGERSPAWRCTRAGHPGPVIAFAPSVGFPPAPAHIVARSALC